jgi:hypothetical protein
MTGLHAPVCSPFLRLRGSSGRSLAVSFPRKFAATLHAAFALLAIPRRMKRRFAQILFSSFLLRSQVSTIDGVFFDSVCFQFTDQIKTNCIGSGGKNLGLKVDFAAPKNVKLVGRTFDSTHQHQKNQRLVNQFEFHAYFVLRSQMVA